VQIIIQNCNNIDVGNINIKESRLNIKYAINGTGKSTLSKAICNSVLDRQNGTSTLLDLTPFKASGDDTIQPSLSGDEVISSIKVFDESYIDEFVYRPDELLKGSFDILIRDETYDKVMGEIEQLVAQIKTHFSDDPELEELINDFNELSASFGRPSKSGIHGSSNMAKALKGGNKVNNIPEGLQIYKDFIQGSNNFKWIKWQLDGNQFIDISDNCPYCVTDVVERKSTIKKVSEVYNSNAIQNLNKIIAVFQRLDKYFSDDTKLIIANFIDNIDGYTDQQVGYLQEVKDQVDRLNEKISQVKNIGFFSLKDVDKVIDQLQSYAIDTNLYIHLQSEDTLNKIGKINNSIQQLIDQAGVLQGKINIQKKHIEKLVKENKTTINTFLRNAGYKYKVDLIEDDKGQHRLKLIHVDLDSGEIKEAGSRLSYGERNAFALVLFMFDAVKDQPDLIVLDDPISSFDKNKKYAIVEMLFKKEKSFRGKTVLMLSHDLEPIVDMIAHHVDKFDKPFATFLENKLGVLAETVIKKEDIQTFIDVNSSNIENGESIIGKLVYLRRTYEILNSKGMAYQLLSNVFHKREIPTIFEEETQRAMSEIEISEGTLEIQSKIPEFNYNDIITMITNDTNMKTLYRDSTNNYEKLHIYRIIYDDKLEAIQADVIQKFINQAFHIENDYIYQLNPAKFQTVPQYVIDECDTFIDA
jgi:ABC-type dipeptide/oligopeptide/nickel transport system ATPase subunit